MSVTNGVVSTPIKLSEIATLLGVDSKLSAVASLASAETVKFNKWSKYKPVHTYGVLTEGRTEKTPLNKAGSAPWWKGERKNCDWLYTDTTDLATAITNSNKIWTFLYDSDFSNLDRPYRLGDFTGYSHNALQPMLASNMTTKQVYMNDKSVTLSAMQPSDHQGGLTFADMGFDDYYNAAIWDESANNPRIRTGGKIGTVFSINIPVTSFPQPAAGTPKTYTIYGAIAHKEETYVYGGGTKINNHYINLPMVVKNTLTLYNKADWWGYTTTAKGVMSANGILSYNVEGKASGESEENITITVNKLVIWPTASHTGGTYKNITPVSSERTFVAKYGANSTLFSSNKTVTLDVNVYTSPTIEYQYTATYSGYSETKTKYVTIMKPITL